MGHSNPAQVKKQTMTQPTGNPAEPYIMANDDVPDVTKNIEYWTAAAAVWPNDEKRWIVTRAIQAAEAEWNDHNDNNNQIAPDKQIPLKAIWRLSIDKAVMTAFVESLPAEG